MSNHLSPDMVEDLCFMYRAGYGMPELATRYGVTVQSVRRWLLKKQVPVRSVGRRAPRAQAVIERRFRERVAAVEADALARQTQTCVECGRTYAKARWTLLCGAQRCRQQREYHNRRADPVRHAKDQVTRHRRYYRDKYGVEL